MNALKKLLHINPNLAGFCFVNQRPIICTDVFYEYDDSIRDWCAKYPRHQYIDDDDVDQYVLYSLFIVVAIAIVSSITCMIILFAYVRQQEERSSRWMSTRNFTQGRDQKRVLRKTILLACSYLAIYLAGFIGVKCHFAGDPYESQQGDIVATCITASQGILNALVMSNKADTIFNYCCCFCSSRAIHVGGTNKQTENAARKSADGSASNEFYSSAPTNVSTIAITQEQPEESPKPLFQ